MNRQLRATEVSEPRRKLLRQESAEDRSGNLRPLASALVDLALQLIDEEQETQEEREAA